MIKSKSIFKYWILFFLVHNMSGVLAQKITVIGTNTNGVKDTVQYCFADQATLGEDIGLGEQNLFGTPVNDYEIRILQRDEENHECTLSGINDTAILYNENFDSKINFRDKEDTTLSNRMFEVWFSDYTTDSLKIFSEVNLKNFILGYNYAYICDDTFFHAPIGILVIEEEIYIMEFKVTHGYWIKDFIFITLPQDVTTGTEDAVAPTPEIKILPNPISDHFKVETGLLQVDKIIIQNFQGQILQTINSPQKHQEISMPSMASGIYVVHVWLENGHQLVKKIIKQ